jgi:hypothetical protein
MQFTYEIAVYHQLSAAAVSRVTGGPYPSLLGAVAVAMRRVVIEFAGEHLVKVSVYDDGLLEKTIQVY